MATESTDDRVSIQVRLQAGDSSSYTLARDSPLSKIMERVALSLDKPMNSMRFIINGTPLLGTETANMLQIENNDVIEVVWPVTGGGGKYGYGNPSGVGAGGY